MSDLKYNGKVDASTLSGRLRDLGYRRYADYRASDHWQDVRKRFRRSGQAQECRCGQPADVLHHLTYERLGAERLTDLVALCNDCHRAVHGKGKRRRRKPTAPQRFLGQRPVMITFVEPEPRNREFDPYASR